MTKPKSSDDDADMTPGRPKESGSRQQTRPNQASHTGSPSLDKHTTDANQPALHPPQRDRKS